MFNIFPWLQWYGDHTFIVKSLVRLMAPLTFIICVLVETWTGYPHTLFKRNKPILLVTHWNHCFLYIKVENIVKKLFRNLFWILLKYKWSWCNPCSINKFWVWLWCQIFKLPLINTTQLKLGVLKSHNFKIRGSKCN